MAEGRRHKHFTDQQIQEKQQNTIPKSTVACDRKWDKVLIDYLKDCGHDSTEYWCYPDEELDAILVKFWFEVRSSVINDDGENEPYSVASLRNCCNAITRNLHTKGRYIDLSKDSKYVRSQKSFKDAVKELKKIGKGAVKSYPEICHAGIDLV